MLPLTQLMPQLDLGDVGPAAHQHQHHVPSTWREPWGGPCGAQHPDTAAPSLASPTRPLPKDGNSERGGRSDGRTDGQTAPQPWGQQFPASSSLAAPAPFSQLRPDFPVAAGFNSQRRHRVLYLGLYFSVPKSGALEVLVGYSSLCSSALPEPALPSPALLSHKNIVTKQAQVPEL